MEPVPIAVCGAGGIALGEALRIVAGRYGAMPSWLTSRYYWISVAILLVIGAATALLAEPGRPLDALAIGYTAPTLIARMLGTRDDESVAAARIGAKGGAFEMVSPEAFGIDRTAGPDGAVPIGVMVEPAGKAPRARDMRAEFTEEMRADKASVRDLVAGVRAYWA